MIRNKTWMLGFSSGPVVGNLLANAGDMGLISNLRGPHMPWSTETHLLQLLNSHLEPVL